MKRGTLFVPLACVPQTALCPTLGRTVRSNPIFPHGSLRLLALGILSYVHSEQIDLIHHEAQCHFVVQSETLLFPNNGTRCTICKPIWRSSLHGGGVTIKKQL